MKRTNILKLIGCKDNMEASNIFIRSTIDVKFRNLFNDTIAKEEYGNHEKAEMLQMISEYADTEISFFNFDRKSINLLTSICFDRLDMLNHNFEPDSRIVKYLEFYYIHLLYQQSPANRKFFLDSEGAITSYRYTGGETIYN